MKQMTTTLGAALIVFSSVAGAGDYHQGKKGARHFQHERFDYARVVKVEPIYREVKVSEPVSECWKEPVTRKIRTNGSAGGMLAGGIVGGIIGHQLGQGRKNQRVATAMGTLIGASIGSQTNKPHQSRQFETSYREHCNTYERVRYEEVLDGYDVTYRYKGREYRIDMPYDPGKRIKMRISVEPVF